jgi:SulP family sulfate permease
MSARWVPVTVRGYRVSWLVADVLAGLTLVSIALPSQMATARLANVPAVVGLDTFIVGSLLYALLGTNRQLSVGADSTIAPVLATGVATVAVVGSAQYATSMALTAVMVGLVLVVVGALRLGWIAEFLSTPVITGVLAGIAVEIVARQLPVILGIPAGGTTTIGRVHQTIDHLGHTNGWSVGIAVGVLTVIVVAQRASRRLPGALLALVLSICAVEIFGLATHHGVTVLGPVQGGLPHVGLPTASWPHLRELTGTVLTVAFVCIAQTAATVRESTVTSATPTDFNRDLIAIGTGGIAAGLVGGLAVDASPPNTTIVRASGARSQLTSVVAAATVFVVVITATGPLAHLPDATLGAVLVFVASKLFHVGELRTVLRFDRVEFGLAVATLLVVALVGIEQGVVLAMILSLADRTRRSARPADAVLGREPGTDHWIPIDIGQDTEQVPGVVVYLVYAPLWYGNADFLRSRIHDLIDGAREHVTAVVLDANGMSDIDYTGLQVLRNLARELNQRGTTLGIARASHLVHHNLKHGALIDQLGADHLFTSVAKAVTSLKRQS